MQTDYNRSEMITAQSFDIAECQVVLFTPGLQFSTARLITGLLAEWVSIFDADPIVLPNSDEMPPEVPRIILSSRDGQHRIQASALRFDIFRRALPDQSGPRISDVLHESLPIINTYKRATNATVDRLAIVLKRIAAVEEPAKVLARHFCKEKWLQGPLNRPQQFELHAHKVFDVPGSVKVNSWFRCKTAVLNQPQQRPGILIEQDFNTLKEGAPAYEQSDIEAFFTAALPAFEEVLEMYFPVSVERSAIIDYKSIDA